jgi:hypothetical protein
MAKKHHTADQLQPVTGSFDLPAAKDTLSQADLQEGINTVAETGKPHAALETADGKNNGAEPAVYQNQRKART